MKKPSSAHKSNKNRKVKPTAAGEVRIIGGQLKRRVVRFVDAEGLRPTPDRLRETLFNWLISDIHDAQVLDSCAGSGVLGFEALSRGAAYCIFIEMNAAQTQMPREHLAIKKILLMPQIAFSKPIVNKPEASNFQMNEQVSQSRILVFLPKLEEYSGL